MNVSLMESTDQITNLRKEEKEAAAFPQIKSARKT